MKRKRLTSRSASQIAWREMRDGDWHVRRDVGECTLHISDGGLFRDLSCDDRESGPASGAKRFAPWPGGKESRFSCPGVSVHQQNICVPPSSAMLECIIENNDIDTLGDCLSQERRPSPETCERTTQLPASFPFRQQRDCRCSGQVSKSPSPVVFPSRKTFLWSQSRRRKRFRQESATRGRGGRVCHVPSKCLRAFCGGQPLAIPSASLINSSKRGPSAAAARGLVANTFVGFP